MKITFPILISVAALAVISSCQALERPCDKEKCTVLFSPTLTYFSEESALTKTQVLNGEMPDGRTVYLHAIESSWTIDREADTKSAPVTGIYPDFSVSGYAFLGAWDGLKNANLFYKASVSRAFSEWRGDGTRMIWPGADYNTRFFAVSPASATGLDWVSDQQTQGAPVVSYTVLSDIGTQLDLLESVSGVYAGDGSDAGGTVALNFTHALSAIDFKAADLGFGMTVKSVGVSGVYDSGRHSVGAPSWTDHSGSATYSVSMDTPVPASGVTVLTEGVNTLIVMPQTCPADARIIATVNYNGRDYELVFDLKGQTWEPGKRYTYTLSLSQEDWLFYMVDLAGVPETIEFDQSFTFTVKSFRQHLAGFREPLSWTMDFSTDGGTSWSDTPPAGLLVSTTAQNTVQWCGGTITVSLQRKASDSQEYLIRFRNSGQNRTIAVGIDALGPFGKMWIAPGPLYFDGTKFIIKDEFRNHILDDWADYYGCGTYRGPVEGSYYFNFLELGRYFDSRGDAFGLDSGSIDNKGRKVSYGGYDDWRVPTERELSALFGFTYRNGSTVNGEAQFVFSACQLYPTGDQWARDYRRNVLIWFPDNEVITFNTENQRLVRKNMVKADQNTLDTESLFKYLEQGCVAMPAMGVVEGETFRLIYQSLTLWESTAASNGESNCFLWTGGTVKTNVANLKDYISMNVYLVRGGLLSISVR